MRYKVKFIKNVITGDGEVFNIGEIYEFDEQKYEAFKEECEVVEIIKEETSEEKKERKKK